MLDYNGVYLIQGLLKAAQENKNGGFFTYNYKPPNLQEQEEKLSYVIEIPELDCIIGTGRYMRLYYQDQTEAIQRITLFTLLAALVILLTSFFPLQRIRQTRKRLEIPLSARIFAVVDVWDALISDRPYQNGWKPEKIRQYLVENKSVQFDPDLVDIFIQLMDRTDRGEFDEDEKDCWL